LKEKEKETWKVMEDEKEDVSSYWMTIRQRSDPGI
jgi:hypothetical protein